MTGDPLQDFKDRVEAFLVSTGMKHSRFGRLACRDQSFVSDLRAGRREFRITTIAKVDRFMAEELEKLSQVNADVNANPSRNQAA